VFTDTITFGQNTEFDLPDGWTANINPVLTSNTYNAGDSIFATITVNYPSENLPYFVQRIEIRQFIQEQNPDGTGINIETSVSAMIYFTPYNTIEIWSMQDFTNLPRRWHFPENSNLQERIYIDKSSLPVSNINFIQPINWYDETKSWEEDWMDNFREINISGLAYNILMSPIPPDSIEYYDNYGDGPDSATTKKTFSGSVYGQLRAYFINDLGLGVYIPLAGIKVKLRENDFGGITQNFGETYTDENGNYYIAYSKSQLFEGNNIELFLKFVAATDNSTKITAANFWGNRYEYTTGQWSSGQTNYNQQKNYVLWENTYPAEAFKSVHWARRGFQYFSNQNATLQKNLQIKPYANNSWYEPALIPPIFEPTIHLADNDGDRENILYHEFGHFTMHRLQNNNFTTPYGEDGFNHFWTKENTSLLAWAEGWANVVQMILDAAYWQEDGEYARDENDFFEVREHHSWSSVNQTFNYINNGFRSEYYIACAIYDLWDGTSKGLPNTIPGSNLHGWNDTEQGDNGWRSEDDVEINFYQICKPLIDHPSGDGGYLSSGKIKNIQDYYMYLLDNMGSNCNIKSDISRVFRENRVQWNIPEYEWGWHSSNLTSDYIWQTKEKYENPSSALISNWYDDYRVNFYNDDNFNEYRYSAWPSKDLLITDNYNLGIWDDFSSVYRQAELYLNDAIRPDYTGFSSVHGDYTTCGCIEIDVRNGKLELGGIETTATLTVNNCSTIRLRNHGKLVINDNSTLIIECGAALEYEEGAIIELNGENAQLIIKGKLGIGSNTTFLFHGTGSLTKLGPSDLVIPYPNSANSSFIVESGTNTVLVAKNSIRLKPGFHAKAGCHFRAYLDPSLPDCDVKSLTVSSNGDSNLSQTLSSSDKNSYSDIKWEPNEDSLTHKKDVKLLTRLIGNYPNP
ncbi:MAG: hypothetical protein HY738_22110, partial [Bacteroidia bacterium]|nr:hypothetical protein [Bacteroidia bacterium]